MKPIIQVTNLTYTYENEKEPVLKDISLSINQGEFVLIVGPSGSGKSTLCQAFNGIVPNVMEGEVAGDVIVDGKIVHELELKDLATSLGLVFQDPDAQLCNIYVEDEIAFAPENLKVNVVEIQKRIKETLAVVGLSGYEHRKVFELSGGQKQKIGIASILSMQPKILVLDNATANLDPQATKDIFDLLKILHRDHATTVVVVESKIDDIIHLVDRMIVMDVGRIVADGTPRETLRTQGELLVEMGLWIPEISELALKMRKGGEFAFHPFPISVEEAYTQMQDQWIIDLPNDEDDSSTHLSDEIRVKNLTYHYPSGTKALDDVNFSIKPGDFVAILGTNGSGKTTLVKHLMGIIKPPKETVFIKEQDIAKRSLLEMTEFISYVFQNPEHQFVTDNVFEECIYSLREQLGIKKHQELPAEIIEKGMSALKQINLQDAKDKNPFVLSAGEKRRLSVVASIILGQDIVILDEPTVGQDYASATKLLELCHDLHLQGKTVLMITHDIRLACRWAKSALVMHAGKPIYHGKVSQLFLDEDILRQASLIEPPISQLAKRLKKNTLTRGIITIEQFTQNSSKAGENVWV